MTMPPTNPVNDSEPLLVTFNLDINSFENMVMTPIPFLLWSLHHDLLVFLLVQVMKDMSLGVMMRINLQWMDSRLQFDNIREDQFKVTS